MKTSLRKLKGFTLQKHGPAKEDRRDLRPFAQMDELAQASLVPFLLNHHAFFIHFIDFVFIFIFVRKSV